MTKTIELTFYIEQIVNDLLSNCYLIRHLLADGLTDELKASINNPDSDETKSLICRAVTESWGKVKYLCQRYVTAGRTKDTNKLERLMYANEASSTGYTYEELNLTLQIPNFNTAVTDILKSAIHKYITDYVTYRFLQNIVPEKSGEYKALCEDEDASDIIKYLNAREVWTRRRPSYF